MSPDRTKTLLGLREHSPRIIVGSMHTHVVRRAHRVTSARRKSSKTTPPPRQIDDHDVVVFLCRRPTVPDLCPCGPRHTRLCSIHYCSFMVTQVGVQVTTRKNHRINLRRFRLLPVIKSRFGLSLGSVCCVNEHSTYCLLLRRSTHATRTHDRKTTH